MARIMTHWVNMVITEPGDRPRGEIRLHGERVGSWWRVKGGYSSRLDDGRCFGHFDLDELCIKVAREIACVEG